MNKAIVTIIIVIVIIGSFFLFFNKGNAPVENTQTPTVINTTDTSTNLETTNQNANKTVVVTYTNSGFSPNTITINKGDAVKFVNQSSGDMWVASNPHPIHTDYSTFDEKTTVSKGGSYSFIFDNVGSWSYHNHKSPSNTGTVVVK